MRTKEAAKAASRRGCTIPAGAASCREKMHAAACSSNYSKRVQYRHEGRTQTATLAGGERCSPCLHWRLDVEPRGDDMRGPGRDLVEGRVRQKATVVQLRAATQ